MKIKNTFLVLICALLAAGCASAPQSQTAASSDVQKRVAELAPHHALVIAGVDGTIRTYDGRGLRPLFNALEENGVDHQYFVCTHSGHGLQNDNAVYRQWMESVEAYLDRYIPVA